MADWIEGPVTQIIDGDTFDMRVEWVGKGNSHIYNSSERIRVAGVHAPELGSRAGEVAKQQLQDRIGGRYVHCTVQTRDRYGRPVCGVQVVPRRVAA